MFKQQPRAAHERSAFTTPMRQQGFRPPRQQVSEVPKNVASALRVKNFKLLLDTAGEEGLAIALDMSLPRVKQLAEGLDFSNETTHHIETTLRLTSGFLDQVNPKLTTEEVSRLKSPPQDERLDEPLTPPKPPRLPESTTGSAPARIDEVPPVSATSTETDKENLMPRSKATPPAPPAVQQQAAAPQAAPAAEGEEGLREVRRLNLLTLTQRAGAKTRLGQLTGLSAANVSHRLHGNKIFDQETSDFFCSRLGLPAGWFEQPRTEADIPEATMKLLTDKDAAPLVAPTGLPVTAAKKARTPRKPRAAAPAPAPTHAQAAAGAPASGSISLSVGSMGKSSLPTPAAAAAPAAAAPAVAPRAPAAARTPVARPAATPAAAPVAAAAPQVSVAELAMAVAAGGVGPIAEALIRTLASKSREGRLQEDRALQMLVEAAAL